MLFDLLTEIIGTKTKVAVLRVLIFSPGIAARKVQEKCGKSWGATSQAINVLLETGIILVKKGTWNDELFVNPDHCLYESIKNIYKEEKESLRRIAKTTLQYSSEYGFDIFSFYLLPEEKIVCLVCKYIKKDIASKQIQEFIYGQGLPKDIQIELYDSTSFSSIWHQSPTPNNFVLLDGTSYPYRGIERALTFFEIEDDVYSEEASFGDNK